MKAVNDVEIKKIQTNKGMSRYEHYDSWNSLVLWCVWKL